MKLGKELMVYFFILNVLGVQKILISAIVGRAMISRFDVRFVTILFAVYSLFAICKYNWICFSFHDCYFSFNI